MASKQNYKNSKTHDEVKHNERIDFQMKEERSETRKKYPKAVNRKENINWPLL